MAGDEAAEMLRTSVRADLAMWRSQGIDVSTWGINPDTGRLEIGVRTPTAAAAEPLRQRYGPDKHVYFADVGPAGRAQRG